MTVYRGANQTSPLFGGRSTMYASSNASRRCYSHMLRIARYASSPADSLPATATRIAETLLPRGHVRSGLAATPHFPISPTSREEVAINLFQKVADGDAISPQSPESPQIPLAEWEITARVGELKKSPIPLLKKLSLFESNVLPSFLSMRGQIPRHLWLSTTHFLAATCDLAAEQGQTTGMVRLSRLCARVGKFDLDLRGQLVLSLCHTIVTRRHSDSSRGFVLREILAMWKHISQLRRPSRSPPSKDRRLSLHFVLPAADEIRKVAKSERLGTSSSMHVTQALASIFTQFSFHEASPLVPALLATVAILLNPTLTSSIRLAEAAPLLDLVAVALRGGFPDVAYVRSVLRDRVRFSTAKLPDLEAYLVAHWTQTSAALQDSDAPWCRTSENSRYRGDRTSLQLGEFHKELRVAYAARHGDAIVSIWNKLKAHLAQHPNLVNQMRADPEFLDFWIFVWCAMRRPNLLRDTLQLMDKYGLDRTVKSYTAMMHGWKMCKDTNRIVMLWQRLTESGLQLDTFIWTERISGLMQGGRYQAGIHALAEMMSFWKKEVETQGAKKAATTAVQPTIEVVNAALVGLIRADFNAALRVLNWASTHGIRPNISTYNILIGESLRRHRDVNVPGLLQKMALQGIEPDEATFTVILEDLLGSIDCSSAVEQVQAVTQVINEMKTAGLRPNLQTYGKMLQAVASLADGGADEAIAAVQSQMRADGLSFSPHIVTILIERALARGPPSPSALQAILREHNFVSVAQGDQTLWERAMSAYAITGDAQAALTIFDDLARAGQPAMSLSCLRELLRALLAAERHSDGRRVVHTTLSHRAAHEAAVVGDAGRGEDRYWRHNFWHLAFDHGLLSRDDLPAQWG